jgi:hypothetical protein
MQETLNAVQIEDYSTTYTWKHKIWITFTYVPCENGYKVQACVKGTLDYYREFLEICKSDEVLIDVQEGEGFGFCGAFDEPPQANTIFLPSPEHVVINPDWPSESLQAPSPIMDGNYGRFVWEAIHHYLYEFECLLVPKGVPRLFLSDPTQEVGVA